MRSSLNVLDYNEPAIVGTTVSFNCLNPGEELTGSNTSTCVEFGQWEPDPRLQLINYEGTILYTGKIEIIKVLILLHQRL